MMKWGTAEDSRFAAKKLNKFATKIVGNEIYSRLLVPASLNFIRGALVKWIG